MKFGVSLMCLMILTACSSDPTPTITQRSLTVTADASVNPSATSKANPVVVRLYQLKDQQMFKQLAFIDLYNNDVQLLAANLISRQVLPVVMPDSKTSQTIDIDKDTQYLAVLAEFSNYQDGEAKAVSTLPTEDDQYLQISLNDDAVTIEVITPESSWWQIF